MIKPKCVDCGKESFECQATITDQKPRCMKCRPKVLLKVLDDAQARQEASQLAGMLALRRFLRD